MRLRAARSYPPTHARGSASLPDVNETSVTNCLNCQGASRERVAPLSSPTICQHRDGMHFVEPVRTQIRAEIFSNLGETMNPYRACPRCHRSDRMLAHAIDNSIEEYFGCGHCGHAWSYAKRDPGEPPIASPRELSRGEWRRDSPAMPTTSHDIDSRVCPRCGHAVFRSLYPVLAIRAAQGSVQLAGRIRHTPAWVCRNGSCDYREPFDMHDPVTTTVARKASKIA